MPPPNITFAAVILSLRMLMSVIRPLLVLGLLAAAVTVWAEPDVAVYARTYNGYTRTRLEDQSFKPEGYVFAEGGRFRGAGADNSVDGVTFADLARAIAGPLQQRGYVPSFDPKHTDCVIFVFWGMTTGAVGRYSDADVPSADTPQDPVDASITDRFEQGLRDRNNAKNAWILGYQEELQNANQLPRLRLAQEAVDELEYDRYFVVLKAVDYRAYAAKKQKRLLWETRFSVAVRGKGFAQELGTLTKAASQYFGDNVPHLIRSAIPAGKVEVGTPTPVPSPQLP